MKLAEQGNFMFIGKQNQLSSLGGKKVQTKYNCEWIQAGLVNISLGSGCSRIKRLVLLLWLVVIKCRFQRKLHCLLILALD